MTHCRKKVDTFRGGGFRESYYKRLKAHFQLKNELILFAEVDHHLPFSINTFSGEVDEIGFDAIFNIFDPGTIRQSERGGNELDPIPGIKNLDGGWETRGHPERILKITERELELFTRLFEESETPPLQARLPQVHSRPLLKVLEKFAKAPQRLGELKGQYYPSDMFNEVNAQRDGMITRQQEPSFQPGSADKWVVSGPHFYVGNPFNKTPRTACTANGHYDAIDLESIPSDYLPRAVYRPGDENGDLTAFYNAIPEWPKPQKPIRTDGGWQPGFWPIADEYVAAFEALLGEPLERYGIDTSRPGARTARQFGFFSRWEGDVEAAIRWLRQHGLERNAQEFTSRFGAVRLEQVSPQDGDMELLPKPLTARPRVVYRRRGQPANERTLIAAMMPAGITHIHPVLSYAYLDDHKFAVMAGHSFSILYDFLVRVAGRSDIYDSTLRPFPIVEKHYWPFIKARALRLSCLTSHFSELWHALFEDGFKQDAFAMTGASEWSELSPAWSRDVAFRSDTDRRQAELELDVLLALGFGLSVDELIQIYSVQFSALLEYEKVDEYDSQGQRLPNTKRKDAGGREVRDARADNDGISPLTVSWETDNGNQIITRTFYPPFHHVDRMEDYRTAYRVFAERLGIELSKSEASAMAERA